MKIRQDERKLQTRNKETPSFENFQDTFSCMSETLVRPVQEVHKPSRRLRSTAKIPGPRLLTFKYCISSIDGFNQFILLQLELQSGSPETISQNF